MKTEHYISDKSPRIAFQKTASLVLASASDRRRKLMERLNRPFVSEVSHADESIPHGMPAEDVPEYLARIKAKYIFEAHKGQKVTSIGCDTIVLLDGKILGKPHSREEAFNMLSSLSGKTHEVRTGVCVMSSDPGKYDFKSFSFTSSSKVEFYPLSPEEIWDYINTGEPFDKAGAYGIQGQGALLVKKIDGDFYTVVGLPVAKLERMLKANGI